MEWTLSDWISAISALLLLLAVTVSLYLGLKSLHNTEASEKRQEDIVKKENIIQLLNEIIQWATNVAKVEYLGMSITGQFQDWKSFKVIYGRYLSETTSRCELLIIDGKYINSIASKLPTFSQELKTTIGDVNDRLNKYLKNVDDCIRNFPHTDITTGSKDIILPLGTDLQKACEIIIEKATNMKLSNSILL